MIRGLSAVVVVLVLCSCESDPPAIAPPSRVDAGAIRLESSRIEAEAEAELKRLEEQSAAAAPAIPDAGQKSGVNE